MHAINIKHKILLLFVGVCTALCSQAQVFLTLDSCLSLAQQNNKQIQQALLDVSKAKEVKKQAMTHYFPQVTASAMGYHSLHPILEIGIDDIGNASVRDLLIALYGNYGAALGLENTLSLFHYGYQVGVTALQPIYMGGKITTGNQLADIGIQAADLQAQITQRDVLQEVEESYWLVLGLREKQSTLIATMALLDTIHQTVEAAVEAGLVLSKDLLQVELKQSEMRRTQIQLTNGLQLAQQALCLNIGLPYSNSLLIVPTTHSQMLPEEQTFSLASPSATTEHQLLSLHVRAAQLQHRMALSEALPQVALGAHYGYGKLQANWLSNNLGSETGNGTVFVSMSLPLSGWWETSHKLREQKMAIQQAQLQQEQMGEMLNIRTKQAYNQMQEALLLIQEYQTALDISANHYHLTQASYQAGQATIAELLEAHTLLLKAHNDLTDAHITYRVNARRYAAYQ